MISSLTARNENSYLVPPQSLWVMIDKMAAAGAIVMLSATILSSSVTGDQGEGSAGNVAIPSIASSWFNSKETVASGYLSAPYYHRSDLHLQRPNGTDLTLKNMSWDGDTFYFPIDGGARVIRWTGAMGVMVDFMHSKAIARLGKGAHGRKIRNGIVEDVETTGTLKGAPAPSPLHLTDLFDRLEFTHGHNVLYLSGLVRLPPIAPRIRPYFGVGFGAAVPHVETWFAGEPPEKRTNEYQYAGPAVQFLAGLELRIGRGSYYVEYKFVWSAIEAVLTGGKSWSLKDLKSDWLPRWFIEPFSGLTEMPGDMWRQFTRWRTGATPPEGTLETSLTSHNVVIGGGYVWPGASPASVGPPSP